MPPFVERWAVGSIFVGRREPAFPKGRADRAKWWAREDLNLRPHAYQARALTS